MPLSKPKSRTDTWPSVARSSDLAKHVAVLAIGTVALAISSQIAVPMIPVPITMQTFAVTLIGALYGPGLAFFTICAWLVEGAIGMPVYADFGSGVVHLLGPTGGYLLAFPFVGAFVGWLTENGGRKHLGFALLSMLVGNALCLILGAAWLTAFVGADKAILLGVVPFIVGGILKSALAASILKLLPSRHVADL